MDRDKLEEEFDIDLDIIDEYDNIEEELESFKTPQSLTLNELKSLL